MQMLALAHDETYAILSKPYGHTKEQIHLMYNGGGDLEIMHGINWLTHGSIAICS